MDFVDIPNLRVLSSERKANQWIIRATFVEISTEKKSHQKCKHCGESSKPPVQFRPVIQEFLDLPIHGLRTVILLERPQLLCVQCKTVSPLITPSLHESLKMTMRLLERCFFSCFKHRFEEVADALVLDVGIVRTAFHQYLQDALKQRRSRVPGWLGVELISPKSGRVLVISDVAEAKAIDAIKEPDDRKIIQYFEKMPWIRKLVGQS